MGKWRAFIPIVIAIAIASAGSMFLYKWLKTRTAPEKIVQVEKFEALPVVVAATDLQWGTKIKKEMVKTVPFLKESLPTGNFSDIGPLIGRVTTASIKMNEPVLAHRLASDKISEGGVSALLKPGNRAISVQGNKVLGLSGFIVPSNRVDVLVTMENPATQEKITKIVLENLLVLATGAQASKNEKGEPAPVDVYTLEVTPEEGEMLTLAANHGKLQFALRSATDSKTVLTRGATIPQTLAAYQLTNQVPLTQKPKESKRVVKKKRTPRPYYYMEVIKDGKIIKKKMRL